MKDEELIEIVRKYADYFKLTIKEDATSFKVYGSTLAGCLTKKEKKYFRYWSNYQWHECKTSDLMIAVLEEIPIHECGNVL